MLYFLTGAAFIISGHYTTPVLSLCLKSLIIPFLILLFLLKSGLTRNNGIFILAALLFSWAGDIFLDIPNNEQLFFIAGLLSFLLAHVMYLTAFLKTPGENALAGKKWLLLLPVTVYGAVLISLLYKDLGIMKIPVILYTIVILSMLTGAVNLMYKVSTRSYLLILSGAILFVISDSLIAVNRFALQFNFAGASIMITYILAQYLIVSGYLLRPLNNGNR